MSNETLYVVNLQDHNDFKTVCIVQGRDPEEAIRIFQEIHRVWRSDREAYKRAGPLPVSRHDYQDPADYNAALDKYLESYDSYMEGFTKPEPRLKDCLKECGFKLVDFQLRLVDDWISVLSD